jgi:hypothetical protein
MSAVFGGFTRTGAAVEFVNIEQKVKAATGARDTTTALAKAIMNFVLEAAPAAKIRHESPQQ